METTRRIGLFGATSIGVGAIVGGGILALAGTAFDETGAGAVVAFGLNGAIALATAFSFAELATASPRSGGTYAFAKRVLPIGAAFSVGWVVWFASIVAGVLYALGFAAFAVGGVEALWGEALPAWVHHPWTVTACAGLSTAGCAAVLARASRGSGLVVNVAKVVVFGVLIGGGMWVWLRDRTPVVDAMTPLFPAGAGGLVRAMGFTFIALQGFDLIAAVGGEVRDPRRTLPRAIFLALGIALAVYLPLLVVVTVVGVPAGTSITELAAASPDTLLAEAAGAYLGASGFWVGLVAGLLSMLSAVYANLYAASRIAQAMARDRTLPALFASVHARLGTPVVALCLTTGIALTTLAIVRDVASAGAASSLIFLLTFALANVLCIVTRKRKPKHGGFRVPLWPWLPVLAAVACAGLALFQSAAVPAAGLVTAGWLGIGGLFYIKLFARHARVRDAIDEVVDADLLELRGRSPLVLVPTDRTTDPGVLALFAACMTPARVGRVLLLNVVPPLKPELAEEFEEELAHASYLLRDSLRAAIRAGARTEGLATVGRDRWREIERVARTHRCAAVLVGMQELSDAALRGHLEELASDLQCNLLVLRVPPHWRPEEVRRVLVPIRGSGAHSTLRARLLASLRHRAAPDMKVVYLLVLPTTTTEVERSRRERAYTSEMRIETDLPSEVVAVLSDDVSAAVAEQASGCELLVLGLTLGKGQRAFSPVTRKIVASTDCPTLVISQRE